MCKVQYVRVIALLLGVFLLVAETSCTTSQKMKKKAALERQVTLVTDGNHSPFQQTSPSYKVGIALSGGGARGFAHAGFLKAMDELGIKAGIISGTSAGAIAGAMYASGMAPDSMLKVFGNIRLLLLPRLRLKSNNTTDTSEIKKERERLLIYNTKDIERILKITLPDSTFEGLKIPLVVNATNLEKGQNTYFHQGDLIHPVVASSAIPMVFSAVEIGGSRFVDGGVMQNLAVSPIRNVCKYVIAVSVNPMEDYSSMPKMQEADWERVFRLMVRANTLKDREMADLFIEPVDLVHYKVTDTKQSEEMFWIGYREGKKALSDFIRLHPDVLQ